MINSVLQPQLLMSDLLFTALREEVMVINPLQVACGYVTAGVSSMIPPLNFSCSLSHCQPQQVQPFALEGVLQAFIMHRKFKSVVSDA